MSNGNRHPRKKKGARRKAVGKSLVYIKNERKKRLEKKKDIHSESSASSNIRQESPQSPTLNIPSTSSWDIFHTKVGGAGSQSSWDFRVPSRLKRPKISCTEVSTQTSPVVVKTAAVQTVPIPVTIALVQASSKPETVQFSPIVSTPATKKQLRETVLKDINNGLPKRWIAFEKGRAICAQMLSPLGVMSGVVQRAVCASLEGGYPRIFVHCVEVTQQSVLEDIVLEFPPVELVEEFVGTFLEIVNRVCLCEVCVGADDVRFRDQWATFKDCVVDKNIFQENRYTKTLRSKSCQWLVPQKSRRCDYCNKVINALRKRLKRRIESGGQRVDPICYLSPIQMEATNVKQSFGSAPQERL